MKKSLLAHGTCFILIALTACKTSETQQNNKENNPLTETFPIAKQPMIREAILDIQNDTRLWLAQHPSKKDEALIIKDIKKIFEKFAYSSDKEWEEYLKSPMFYQNLASYDVLSGTSESVKNFALADTADQDLSAAPPNPDKEAFTQKGMLTVLSLVTLASAINAGYSVSFRKTNGYFCVYNKALIASIGVSLASATFLAVAMGLEKPGENFDNILQILGIGAGSLITLQAIATGLFGFINEKKFSSGKNLGGELESWISYYVNNKELPEDLEKVIKELNDNAFRGLTDTEKSKIKTFVTTEINKKDNYAKPEIKNKKDDITDKITKFLEARKKLTNTLHIEETDLDKLHQFLDLNFGPEIEVIHENLENFKKDPNFNTMVSGSYRAGGDTPEYIKGYNKVRSLFRQYLQSQGIETKGLYTETFYHYAESYRDLVTKDKIPAQYLFKLKESPEDLSAVDWSSWNKRSEIIRALEYNKVEGIPRTNWSQYGSINGEIFHVQFYNEVSSLNKKMMVGSIVGLAAGVTTIVSSIQKDSPLRLAETQSFDSLLYKVGKKISRLQELLQNY